MNRLEASREAMAEEYPMFRFRRVAVPDGGLGHQEVGEWRGSLTVVRATEGLAELFYDLECGRLVRMLRGGELLHRPDCKARHRRQDWMREVTAPFPEFEVRVRYAGGSRHPVSWVLRPELRPGLVGHLNRDGTVCPYFPPDGVWSWERGTVATYVDYVAVWIAKRVVWERTGHWPGRAHPAIYGEAESARYHLRVIAPEAQCWCGSGGAYKKCHRKVDREFAAPRGTVGKADNVLPVMASDRTMVVQGQR